MLNREFDKSERFLEQLFEPPAKSIAGIVAVESWSIRKIEIKVLKLGRQRSNQRVPAPWHIHASTLELHSQEPIRVATYAGCAVQTRKGKEKSKETY